MAETGKAAFTFYSGSNIGISKCRKVDVQVAGGKTA